MTHALSDNHLALLARQQGLEQEMLEGFRSGEEATNCVRYGLMEFGGFTRFASLTGEQIRHMMTQERGNFVLWNVKNRTCVRFAFPCTRMTLAQIEMSVP